MKVSPASALLHATAVALAIDADGPLAGVLILGPSGAGKSSLAFSAIESCPFRRTALVADDQVLIDSNGVAAAPMPLQGLVEVRGFGPAAVKTAGGARLVIAVDLGMEMERLPIPSRREVAPGFTVPVYPFRWTGGEAAAAHRLRLMVRQVLCGQTPEEPQDARPQRGRKPA